MTLSALATSVAGLLFGLSLIVSVGAQNLYVLKQGLTRAHVPTVVAVCGVSDIALIVVGVAGAGAVLAGHRSLLEAVRVVGALFLFAYAAVAARRAVSAAPSTRDPGRPGTGHPASRAAVLVACLAFTWLNPAVYLDTVVLVGSVANSAPGRQWWFAAGAALGSVAWFAGLGFGAGVLAPVFAHPVAWRWLDGFTAVAMTAIGLRVLLGG